MKAVCNYCDRTAHGTRDELISLGWSWVRIQKPFHRRFAACWRHSDQLSADVDAAIEAHKKVMDRRRRRS